MHSIAKYINPRRYLSCNQEHLIPKKWYHVFKKYWKVALPLHIVLSLGFFGSSYLITKQLGFDVIKFLRQLGVKEDCLDRLQNSKHAANFGANLTVSFALYKLLLPVRCLCTVIGTKLIVRHVPFLRRSGKHQ